MLSIRVNIAPYKGDYEWDTDRVYNTHEWRWITKVSGYQPLTIRKGWDEGDPSLFLALAIVCMVRANRIQRDQVEAVADDLAEAPVDGESITVVGDPDGDADDPPALTSEPDAPSPKSSLEKQSSSGERLRNGLEASAVTPPPTSLLRSGTS